MPPPPLPPPEAPAPTLPDELPKEIFLRLPRDEPAPLVSASPPLPTMPLPSPEAPSPTLPVELIEEIFLRLPPDEPAWLVRCSLASKPWHALLNGPAFRGRYREFHGAPPMLGFFHSGSSHSGPTFLPTTKFGAGFLTSRTGLAGTKDYAVWDCRHGRVLLCNRGMFPFQLVAWDPMTGRRWMLQAPKTYDSQRAAVLCHGTGYDHGACHEGSFGVVFVGLYNSDDGCVAHAHGSLPEMAEWSKPCAALDLRRDQDAFLVDRPPVFVQDALYFMIIYGEDDEHDDDDGASIPILKYDLGSHCLSLFDAPRLVETDPAGDTILMAMQDGALGFAHVDGSTLNLWSRKMASNGVATWTQRTVIDLKTVIPIQNPKERLGLIGSVEGADVIFVTTHLGIYEINLKSLRWKKIWKREEFRALIPFLSFYIPPERVSRCDAAH